MSQLIEMVLQFDTDFPRNEAFVLNMHDSDFQMIEYVTFPQQSKVSYCE